MDSPREVEDSTADTLGALSPDTGAEDGVRAEDGAAVARERSPEPEARVEPGTATKPEPEPERAQPRRQAGDRSTATVIIEGQDPDTDEFERTVLLEELAQRPRVIAKLERLSRPDIGQTWELPLGTTTIGTKGTDIELDRRTDPAISRRHARIEIRESPKGIIATILDLRSSNGTFLGNRRVRTATALSDGCEFRLGNVEFRFWVEARSDVAPPQRVTALLTDPVSPPIVRVGAREDPGAGPVLAVLERRSEPDAGRTWPLRRGSTTLGTEDADITFDPEADSATSRRHARIDIELDSRGGMVAWIVDLFSKNGTLLGDRKLEPGERTPLLDGDALRVGSVDLRFVAKKLAATESASPRSPVPYRSATGDSGKNRDSTPQAAKPPSARSPAESPPARPSAPRGDRPRPFY